MVATNGKKDMFNAVRLVEHDHTQFKTPPKEILKPIRRYSQSTKLHSGQTSLLPHPRTCLARRQRHQPACLNICQSVAFLLRFLFPSLPPFVYLARNRDQPPPCRRHLVSHGDLCDMEVGTNNTTTSLTRKGILVSRNNTHRCTSGRATGHKTCHVRAGLVW